MAKDKIEQTFFDKLEEKWKKLPLWKKVTATSLYLLIFLAIGWQIYDMQDVTSTTTITVSYNYRADECDIVFKEGIKINSTCPEYVENWALGYDQDALGIYTQGMNLDFDNITIGNLTI